MGIVTYKSFHAIKLPSRIQEHVTRCDFRKVPCPEHSCGSKVVLHALAEHLDGVHKKTKMANFNFGISRRQNYTFTKGDLTEESTEAYWSGDTWQCNNQVFAVKISKTKSTWYVWAHVFEDEDSAKGFRLILHFHLS